MARETKTREIDGFQYECTQFPPKKSLRVFTKLIKMLGPALGTFLKSIDLSKGLKGLMDEDLSAIDWTGALSMLGANVGDDDLYTLFKDVCESVLVRTSQPDQVGGQLKEGTFDVHFGDANGLGRMIKVVKFALEVNYANFFGAALGEAQSLQGDRTSTRVR